MERYKCRLVAKGFSQSFGIDYEETFSPVVRFTSIRSLLAVAAQKRLKVHQMDVVTAFLNGVLEEEIYMDQAEGFEQEGDKVYRLKKSIYGLKQSPRCWNIELRNYLTSIGFIPCSSDPCVYVRFKHRR